MLVGWYLRRSVPWAPLLGCLAASLLAAVALDRWPHTAGALLPCLVACCAAAAAFCFDEVALPVIEVTPRGSLWRRTARLAVALVPMTAWVVLVPLIDLPLEVSAWWLIGLVAITLTAGLAGLASRRSVVAPGSSLAALVVLAVISPVVLGLFLSWDSVYPVGDASGVAVTLWLGVGASGALACMSSLRS